MSHSFFFALRGLVLGLAVTASVAPIAASAQVGPPSVLECPYGYASKPSYDAVKKKWVYACEAAPVPSGSSGANAGSTSAGASGSSTISNGVQSLLDGLLATVTGSGQSSASNSAASSSAPSTPEPDPSSSASQASSSQNPPAACPALAVSPVVQRDVASGPWWDGGGAVTIRELIPGFVLPPTSTVGSTYWLVAAGDMGANYPDGYVRVYDKDGHTSVMVSGGTPGYTASYVCTAGGWSLVRVVQPFGGNG